MNFCTMWIARHAGVPYVVHLHGTFRVPGGTGPTTRLFRSAYRDLESRRLLDRVAVLEARPNKDVLASLADADVFFLPSLVEGMPISVMEAMAAGLPVVASNVGAIPEMIDVPDGGMLLDPQDVDGFAQAIDHLRTHPELRIEMGRHNRLKAQRNYDYDVVVKRLCSVYDDVLDGRAA